jgi:hypothetical protein
LFVFSLLAKKNPRGQGRRGSCSPSPPSFVFLQASLFIPLFFLSLCSRFSLDKKDPKGTRVRKELFTFPPFFPF